MNEIWIYDIIGFGECTTKEVAFAVASADKKQPIRVRINSDGGVVTEGYGIYNTLRRHTGGVVVEIDGIAASAASLIAMAGDQILMADGSYLMIHEAWGGIAGNKSELPATYEQYLALLTGVDDTLVKRYSERTGLPTEKVSDMLKAETWLRADEAVKLGFADEVINDMRAIAFVEEGKWQYNQIPAELLVPTAIAAQRRGVKPTAAAPSRVSERIEAIERQAILNRKRLGV